MNIRSFEPQYDKITEAVLTLIQDPHSDMNLGETKLVKLLYYADCEAYRQLGEPITGMTYLHYPYGPYPDNWQGIRSDLERDGAIAVEYQQSGMPHTRRRWVNLRNAKVGVLTPQETAILQKQVRRFERFNGNDIVKYSHQELGWSLTKEHEPIPYALAGFSDPPHTPDDWNTARRIAANVVSRRTNV